MKKGKSAKINCYGDYKITYGTVDSKNLKSIYLNIQTWVEPKCEINNPQRSVGMLSKKIKHTTLDNLNRSLFKNNVIVDVDLRSSGIQLNKKSFMNLEFVFYVTDNELDIKSEKVKSTMINITDTLIKSVFQQNDYFTFSRTKN
jgi:hypothetical protein